MPKSVVNVKSFWDHRQRLLSSFCKLCSNMVRWPTNVYNTKTRISIKGDVDIVLLMGPRAWLGIEWIEYEMQTLMQRDGTGYNIVSPSATTLVVEQPWPEINVMFIWGLLKTRMNSRILDFSQVLTLTASPIPVEKIALLLATSCYSHFSLISKLTWCHQQTLNHFSTSIHL